MSQLIPEGEHSQVLRNCIDRVLRPAKQMESLLDDLFDVTAIDTGRLAVKKEEGDLASLLKDYYARYPGAGFGATSSGGRLPTIRNPMAVGEMDPRCEPARWHGHSTVLTRCCIVRRIGPYVPGAAVCSCSGVSAVQASINRVVAHTWCANASLSGEPGIARP